jgi:hypothetical protein
MRHAAAVVTTPNVTAEPPEQGADRLTRAAEEMTGAPAFGAGAPPASTRLATLGTGSR